MNFSETLSVRGVCKEWKLEADICLKNKVAIKIVGQEKLKKFIKEVPPNGIQIASHYHLQDLNLNNADGRNLFDAIGPQIRTLNLELCEWKSPALRTPLFQKLTNLVRLEVSTEKNCGQWLEPLMPMSCIHFHSASFPPRLSNLKELIVKGDYSHRTDIFYDILRSSPNLKIIHLSKYHQDEDDLFVTWIVEIILSCNFKQLKSLKLEGTLIQQQIDSLVRSTMPLETPLNRLGETAVFCG